MFVGTYYVSLTIDLAYRMLGIRSNQAEEFVKANVVVKAIRIEENGKISLFRKLNMENKL